MNRVYEWIDIPFFEGRYQINKKGNVKSVERLVAFGSQKRLIKEKILTPHVMKKTNYLRVSLYKNNKVVYRYVHILVAMVFFGPKSDSLVVRHLDCNKHNNNLDNLKYGTPKENSQDSIALGRQAKGENALFSNKLKKCEVQFIRYLIRKKIQLILIAKMFNINSTTISKIKYNQRWDFLPVDLEGRYAQ